MRVPIAALALLAASVALAQHPPHAGQHVRVLKALSPEQIRQYESGAGMGYARAAELNLTGWVMNGDDERVVALVAEGEAENLDVLERQLWRGPSGARVDQVAAERGPASGEYARFEIGRR